MGTFVVNWNLSRFYASNSDFYSEIQELTQILFRISEEKTGGWRLWCELYTFNPGAGGLLGGRNFGTPARGVARTPAKTPARPQPTPSRRAQDGVVSWTLRGSPSHFNMQVRDPVEVFCRVRPDDSEEPCVQVNRNTHPCTTFCYIFPIAGFWLFQDRNFPLAGVWWHFAQACSNWGVQRLQQQGDPVLF